MGNRQSISSSAQKKDNSLRNKKSQRGSSKRRKRRKKARESIESEGLNYYIDMTHGERGDEEKKAGNEQGENVVCLEQLSGETSLSPKPGDEGGPAGEEKIRDKVIPEDTEDKTWEVVGTAEIFGRDYNDSNESGTIKKSPAMVQRKNKINLKDLNKGHASGRDVADPRCTDEGWVGEDEIMAYQKGVPLGKTPGDYEEHEDMMENLIKMDTDTPGDEEHVVIRDLVDKYRKFKDEEMKRNFLKYSQDDHELIQRMTGKYTRLKEEKEKRRSLQDSILDNQEKVAKQEEHKAIHQMISIAQNIQREKESQEEILSIGGQPEHRKMQTLVHTLQKMQREKRYQSNEEPEVWMDPMDKARRKEHARHEEKLRNITQNEMMARQEEMFSLDSNSTTDTNKSGEMDNIVRTMRVASTHDPNIKRQKSRVRPQSVQEPPLVVQESMETESDSDIPYIDDLNYTDFYQIGDTRNGHRVISGGRRRKIKTYASESNIVPHHKKDDQRSIQSKEKKSVKSEKKHVSGRPAGERSHAREIKDRNVRGPEPTSSPFPQKQVIVRSVNTQTSVEDLMVTPVSQVEYKKHSKGRRNRATSPDPYLVNFHEKDDCDEPPMTQVRGKVSTSTETAESWRDEKDVRHGKKQTRDQAVGQEEQMKEDDGWNRSMDEDKSYYGLYKKEEEIQKELSESDGFYDGPEEMCLIKPLNSPALKSWQQQETVPRESSQNNLYNSYERKYNMIKEKYGQDKDPYINKQRPTPKNTHRGDQQPRALHYDTTSSDDDSDPRILEKTMAALPRKQATVSPAESKRFASLRSSIEYDIDVNITGLGDVPDENHTTPKTKGRVRKQDEVWKKSKDVPSTDGFPPEVWYNSAPYGGTSMDKYRSLPTPSSTGTMPSSPPKNHIYRAGTTMSLDRSIGKFNNSNTDVTSDAVSDFHLRQVQITIINDKLISNPKNVNMKKAKAASVDNVMLHTKADYLSILSTEDLSLPPPTRHTVVSDRRNLISRRHSLTSNLTPLRGGSNILPPQAPRNITDDEDEDQDEESFWDGRQVTLTDVNIFQMLFGAQNFDVIKFATYRTACKLRFIQKKTNLYLVDIWNVIEAFRENGLNSFEAQAEVNVARLESLLTTVYYHLNKRLPTTSQINTEYSLGLLMNWLLSAYDPQGNGRIRVLSIKVALSTLCAGKLMDKLRYIFTQISDSNGFMVRSKFEEYLKEVLSLPTAVFEGPSFGYNETAARACFGDKNKVSVNDFLDTMMSDPGPQCLMWLPILHRMAQVENVFHPVQCEGCHRESFMGFRYKCQRCYNYHLCQDCFWRGRSTGNHTSDHEVKEYSSYKSPAKQFGHSLRKSFRCVPASRSNHRIPRFPEQEQTLDLSHIVPATPVPSHNGFPETHSRSHSIDMSSLDTSSATQSPSKMHGSIDSSRVDEEHRLIARYAARLAADANEASRSPTELNFSLDSNRAQRELIAQLEAKNRDILREIQRLRLEQEQAAKASPDPQQPRNPTLLAELRLLRQRRDELEGRMSALQESRRELMVQLEGLMKLLKSQGSPRSTPNSSPRSRTAHSPPTAMVRGSTPSTPGDSLVSVGGDVRQAFGHQGNPAAGGVNVRSLRNDLLVAADSVTNAMSSLVKELNSEASGSDDEDDDEDDEDGFNGKHRKENSSSHTVDEMTAWREEMQQRLQQESEFIAQLRARRDSGQKDSNGRYIPGADGTGTYTDGDESYVKTDDESYMRTDEEDAELYDRDPKELFLQPRYLTDEESYLETDQESYIRTDDEDGGGTDWEETMRRWVNR